MGKQLEGDEDGGWDGSAEDSSPAAAPPSRTGSTGMLASMIPADRILHECDLRLASGRHIYIIIISVRQAHLGNVVRHVFGHAFRQVSGMCFDMCFAQTCVQTCVLFSRVFRHVFQACV